MKTVSDRASITLRAPRRVKIGLEHYAVDHDLTLQEILCPYVLAAFELVESGKDPRLVLGRQGNYPSHPVPSVDAPSTRARKGRASRGAGGKA